MAAAPGPLEIIAAADSVHVQDFTGKIESRYQKRLHGLRLYIPEIHAAGADLTLVEGICSGDICPEMAYPLSETIKPFLGNASGLFFCSDVFERKEEIRQLPVKPAGKEFPHGKSGKHLLPRRQHPEEGFLLRGGPEIQLTEYLFPLCQCPGGKPAHLKDGNAGDTVIRQLQLPAVCGKKRRSLVGFGKKGNTVKTRLLGCLMPVLFNAVIVGAVLTWGYGFQEFPNPLASYGFNALTVGLGELAVCPARESINRPVARSPYYSPPRAG